MNKTIAAIMLVLSLFSCPSSAQVSSNAPDDKTLEQLKKGMTEKQVAKLLRTPGRPRENSDPGHPVWEFDFDGLSVWVELEWSRQDKVAYVTDFKVRRDGQTIAQRENERMKGWSRWVQAHQRQTNTVPNKASQAIGATNAPQSER